MSILELTASIGEYYGKYYKRSSIGTFITHMTEKGFISSYCQGHYAYVDPEVTKHEFSIQHAIDETNEWFHGNAAEYVKAMSEGNALTKKEISDLKVLLSQLEV